MKHSKHITLAQQLNFCLSRHVKLFHLSLSLHQLQLDYWTSASMTKGVLVNVAKGLSLSSEYSLKLVKINDGLIHRYFVFVIFVSKVCKIL